MISPAMTRRLPAPILSGAGCRQIKTAGARSSTWTPTATSGSSSRIWIEAGINVCDPIEVAAHNDIVDFRRNFGKNMAYVGGDRQARHRRRR